MKTLFLSTLSLGSAALGVWLAHSLSHMQWLAVGWGVVGGLFASEAARSLLEFPDDA